MIKRLKLYHYPATRSARVKWLMHELVGDAFDIARVELYSGAQYADEFKAMNLNHNVPVLEIEWESGERQIMLESAAMVAFLADAYPDKALAPAPGASPQRADYMHMLHFGSTWMDMMLWQIRIHEHVLPEAGRDQRTVARYRAKFVDEVEPQLAARLENAPFICGEAFTAADCVVGHSVFWGRGYGLCRTPVLKAYLARLSARPAFQNAFDDAKEFSVAVQFVNFRD